jgi:hypothetical protein
MCDIRARTYEHARMCACMHVYHLNIENVVDRLCMPRHTIIYLASAYYYISSVLIRLV